MQAEVKDMAILQRMPQGTNVQQFSSRIPKKTYKAVSDWAYENRLSFAAAISILLGKAIESERYGKAYTPEPEGKIEPRTD